MSRGIRQKLSFIVLFFALISVENVLAQNTYRAVNVQQEFDLCHQNVEEKFLSESKDIKSLRILQQCQDIILTMDEFQKPRFFQIVQRRYDSTLFSLIYYKSMYDKTTRFDLSNLRFLKTLFDFSLAKWPSLKENTGTYDDGRLLFELAIKLIYGEERFENLLKNNEELQHHFSPMAWAKIYCMHGQDLQIIKEIYFTVKEHEDYTFMDLVDLQLLPKVKEIIQNKNTFINDMYFSSLEGERLKLSELFEKNPDLNAVLIEFWAMSCGTCKKSFSMLESIQSLHTNKLAVYAIASSDLRRSLKEKMLNDVSFEKNFYDNQRIRIENLLNHENYKNLTVPKYYFSNLKDEKKTLSNYPINTLPGIYIIYRDGKVYRQMDAGDLVSFKAFKSKVDALIKQ